MKSSMDTARHEGPPETDREGWLTRERLLVMVLAAATLLALLLCYLLMQPFIPVLAWALALAIVARPLHHAIATRVHNADVAAGLAVGVVALVIILPVAFVLENLVFEAAMGARRVQAQAQSGDWLEKLEQTPWIGPAADWLRENVDVGAAVQQVASFLTNHLTQALAGTIWVVVQLVLVLFTLFFFFRDHGEAMRALRSLMPLSNAENG
jgi:predicted PurR-regulated permease PerM